VLAAFASIVLATFALVLDSMGFAVLALTVGLAGITLAVLTGKEESTSPGSSSSTRTRASRSTSTGPSR